VAVLPDASGDLPVFWWTPGPPCNGCYVPFFVHGSKLPEIVSRAGRMGKQVIPADRASEDSFSPDSFWWLFRQLNDWVKGDAVNSLPGYYSERNPLVRARFNALELAFAEELPDVMRRAVQIREQDPASMAGILDAFSEACVQRVLEAIETLTGNMYR
jgi:secernin